MAAGRNITIASQKCAVRGHYATLWEVLIHVSHDKVTGVVVIQTPFIIQYYNLAVILLWR